MDRNRLRRFAVSFVLMALIVYGTVAILFRGRPVSTTFSTISGGLTAAGGSAPSYAPTYAAAPTSAAASAPLAAMPATTAQEAVVPHNTTSESENGAPIGQPVEVNPFVAATNDNLSTFAVDVDTASFAVARAYLAQGTLPPAELVRVEEFVNSFDYRYPAPNDTFGITIDAAPSPFGQPGTQLVRIGIQGKEISVEQRKPAALTFVVDISGSMSDANRLPLVKEALVLLVEQLREGDSVALVVYGDTAYTVLEPTSANEKERIINAINSLQNTGSTNAEAGLRLGYEVAGRAFLRDGINRVILCSDGVANVGETGPEGILRSIRDYAAQGIELTTIGFGMGDYNDYLMEQLANDGNGSYAYVDTLKEARRVLVENLTGTLQVIARDTKIQVEFNPEVVSEYRLLGYENRAVADVDFRNDKVDAGEIGAGHSVTALYEVKLTEQGQGEALRVQLRWAEAEGGEVREIAQPFASDSFGTAFTTMSAEFRLAAVVAGFAERLRGSPYSTAEGSILQDIDSTMADLSGNDERVQELFEMIRVAEGLGIRD